MSSLTLKNLPAEVHQALKSRALRNARSLNAEAIDCLRKAVLATRVDPEEILVKARHMRDLASVRLDDEAIRALRNEGHL